MSLLRLGPALEQIVDRMGGDAVQVDAARCVRHWDRQNGCRLCAAGCPVGAITLGAGGAAVEIDAPVCVECGFCMQVCPTGAFAGPDETGKLLKTVAVLAARAEIDLACCHAPVAQAESGVDAIVETGSCLAALGTAAYVGLAACGVERVGVRLEACGQCPIGSLVTAIGQAVEAAGALTSIPITIKDAPQAAGVRKPVYATRAPQRSRRSLWGRRGGGEPAAGAQASEEQADGPKQLPHERRALLDWLAQLPGEMRAEGKAFAMFGVAASCSACRVCATVCPTGALGFEAEGENFRLEFAPLACTECGLCTQLCAPGALQVSGRVAYQEAHPVVLHAGRQRQCKRCRAPFAGAGELCPVCDFRRRNPAGSRGRGARGE